MSKHIFRSFRTVNEKNVSVMVKIGWDRSLQRYYLSIFDESDEEVENLIYSNLFATSEKQTLNQLFQVLSDYRVKLDGINGDTIYKEVEYDCRSNAANRVVIYNQAAKEAQDLKTPDKP